MSTTGAGSKEPLIDRIDHVVLTVRSIEATCRFYEQVLGFQRVDSPGRPSAVAFGTQKINLHEVGHTFEPKAATPLPGAGDVCFITIRSIAEIMAHLDACGVPIELGPVDREGAQGAMTSVYFRDPDLNLLEVGRYRTGGGA